MVREKAPCSLTSRILMLSPRILIPESDLDQWASTISAQQTENKEFRTAGNYCWTLDPREAEIMLKLLRGKRRVEIEADSAAVMKRSWFRRLRARIWRPSEPNVWRKNGSERPESAKKRERANRIREKTGASEPSPRKNARSARLVRLGLLPLARSAREKGEGEWSWFNITVRVENEADSAAKL